MSRRPHSSNSYMMMQMMMMENILRNQKLAAEQAAYSQAAYSQAAEQERAAAPARVAAQQAQMDADIQKKIAQPVKLGTLLTSSSGLLGNPLLSVTKLQG